jgi:hypothetical protein
MGRKFTIGQTAQTTSHTVEGYGDGSNITMLTEREHSPLIKIFENPPSARITLNEETKSKEEQSTTEPYELANTRTTDSTKVDTTAPSSGVLVHSRDGSGMGIVEPG